MENKDIPAKLSDEIKEKLAQCKTQEEMREILAQSGVEQLDDALLEAVAGGYTIPH